MLASYWSTVRPRKIPLIWIQALFACAGFLSAIETSAGEQFIRCEKLLTDRSISDEIGLSPLYSQIPERWREFIWLDREFNAYQRSSGNPNSGRLPDGVVPVFSVDVPEERIRRVFSSRCFQERIQQSLRVEKKGKPYVRVFFLNEDEMPGERLSAEFGSPQNRYLGVRLRSRRSYFVWERDGSDGFQIKFRPKRQDRILPPSETYVATAVAASDAIQGILQRAGSQSFAILPEIFGAVLDLSEESPYYYILRAPPAELPAFPPGTTKRAPLAALLGLRRSFALEGASKGYESSGLLEKLAAAGKTTPDEWITSEYIPKFAQFVAETNLRLGIYFETHTQNMSVLVNVSTGEIIRFEIKDMSDVFFDPEILKASFQTALQPPLQSIGEYGGPFQFPAPGRILETVQIKGPQAHFLDFVISALVDFIRPSSEGQPFGSDPVLEGIALKRFLDSYRRSASQITGMDIEFDKQVTEKFAESLSSNSGFISRYNKERYASELFAEIYQQALRAQRARLGPTH